ncbi:hypothetical protein [Aquirufa sp. Wall-65K1]
MKIRLLLALFFCLLTCNLLGQEEVKGKLYPIEQIEGGWNKKYSYKRQIIESPLALQIPLLEAKDPEVSYEFLTYKRQKKSAEIISAFTTGFSVYTFLSKGKVSDGFYWTVVGSAAVLNLYLGTVSIKHFKKALKRYNEIAQTDSKISLQINSHGSSGASMGLAWNYQF